MPSLKKIWEQQDWDRDVKAYYRWKAFLERPNMNEKSVERVKGYMQRIQDRWPNHKME